MRTNKFLHLLFVVITAVLLQGCNREPQSLRIAAHKWPGYEFIFLAEREGYFEEQGIHLSETNSATDSIEKLVKGEVDGAALTLDEVLRVRALGVPLQIVLITDESAGADALVAKQDFKLLSELKGKRIGYEKTVLGAVMLHNILKQAKLKESDVIAVESSIDNHSKDWQENKFDAVITYEPILGLLIKDGGHRIIDSRKLDDLIFDVIAIRSDLDGDYDDLIHALVKGHFKSLNNLRQNPQDIAYRMAAHLGLTGREVLTAFRGLKLPTQTANQQYLGNDSRIIYAANEISKQMLKLGLLEKPDSFKLLVTDKFISLHDHD